MVSATKGMQYLTVQDILWINLQITRKVNKYSFAKLEEATFYQYGYGQSVDVLAQASRFFQGFVKMKPFSDGNKATAFIAGVVFLRLNGYCDSISDESGTAWFDSLLASGNLNGITVNEHTHAHSSTVQEVVKSVLAEFPATVEALKLD